MSKKKYIEKALRILYVTYSVLPPLALLLVILHQYFLYDSKNELAEVKLIPIKHVVVDENIAEETAENVEVMQDIKHLNQEIAEAKVEEDADDLLYKKFLQSEKAKVAIIIQNLGLSRSTTEDSLNLPPEVTLSFSPYSTNIEEYAGRAKAKGHEILLNLPLEPVNYPYDDPGSMGLISSLSPQENLSRLNIVLNVIDYQLGMFTDPNEKFTSVAESTRLLLQQLKERGLLLIFAGSDAEIIDMEASKLSYPIYYTDITIDEKIDSKAIEKQFEVIENLALEHGALIATASPYPVSIRKLREWMYSLESKNIQVVPLTILTGR